MAWRPRHSVATGVLAVAVLVWAARDAWPGRRGLTAPTIRVERAYVESARALGRAETLSDLLAQSGIVGRDRFALLNAATDLPVRRLRPGIVFHFRRLQTDSVADRVTVRLSPERRVRLSRDDKGWLQTTEAIPWTVTRVRVVGVIGSSLYEALDEAVPDRILPLNERRSLAWAIAEVYDWQVDFTRDVHPGDRFRVLFERLESSEGEYRFGRVLAAQVDVGRTPAFAFAFAPDAAQPAGFYDEHGRSLKRAFLRAPLQFRRVSSGFGARYHPILHRWRTHEGIDFAAPYGAPVRATADGMVARMGRGDPGYGNLIEIRHASGIRTRYGHLSAFARGLQVGERVQQGETIGFVGSTGLSTGPHLHYEFLVNGHPTNPRRKDMGAGTPIPHNLRASYDSARAHLSAELEPSVNPIHPPTGPTVAARDD
jgi:murein DD-endopeptidase MepM/ murein hydrolase activator NlpD